MEITAGLTALRKLQALTFVRLLGALAAGASPISGLAASMATWSFPSSTLHFLIKPNFGGMKKVIHEEMEI